MPHRWPARPDWGAWSDRRQQLPAAILGEAVDDLVLVVGEAVTNAILCGFLQHSAGQGGRRGARRLDRGDDLRPGRPRIPHRSPGEPLRVGGGLIGQLVDE